MATMKNDILKLLIEIASPMGIEPASIKLDFPDDIGHGDFATNVAMVNAKKLGMSPRALSEKIVSAFQAKMPERVASVEIAGPGFINFRTKDADIAKEILKVSSMNYSVSRSPSSMTLENDIISNREGNALDISSKEKNKEKVLIEYTDPNTFKVFHIGHLMPNAIGESLSRLIEDSGATVVRICYPSDIGLHIAKSIWAMEKHRADIPLDDSPIVERTTFLGKMYVEGTDAYEKDVTAKDDIDALNKVIYERSSPAINAFYEKGRKWSLDHFEQIYKVLGTRFDDQIYESEMAPVGLQVVKEFVKKGIFEESEGAVVFKGEKYGLHTRVFINSHGLPTYEAKDVGLNITKFTKYPDTTQSIIITASEQNEYFKVLTKVISLIDEKNGLKTKHIGHGMMRFASGKMSSRTGNVVPAEVLIGEIKELVKEKIAGRGFDNKEAEEICDIIAIGAIKYTILRSSVGNDIVFDSAASISFEGDSGPYLQYSVVRANSILKKAKEEGIVLEGHVIPESAGLLEKLLIRFPNIVERARSELAPQIVVNYLSALAGAFNSFYAEQVIVDNKDPLSSYRVTLTKVFRNTMERGLWLLAIKVPEKM